MNFIIGFYSIAFFRYINAAFPHINHYMKIENTVCMNKRLISNTKITLIENRRRNCIYLYFFQDNPPYIYVYFPFIYVLIRL